MKKIKLLVAFIIIIATTKQISAQFTSGINPNTTVLLNSVDNVGIGTPNPLWKLDLNGDFNVANGSVFRSNGIQFLSQNTLSLYFGRYAGASVTSGTDNVFIGQRSGFSNSTGSYNTFLGFKSGYLTTSGSFNTFLGTNAGEFNTASHNSFVGSFAGVSNTTGEFNTFIGASAGGQNQSGNSNIFIGFATGGLNISGDRNSFLGTQSGELSTGNENTFIGYKSGNQTSTGNGNSFFGSFAGENNDGDKNIFIGNASGLTNTTGDENVMVGNAAGAFSSDASKNVCIGYQNGEYMTSYHNTSIGYNAGRSISDPSGIGYNTIIGAYAGDDIEGSVNIFIGRSAGLGSSSPSGTAKSSSNILIGDQAGLNSLVPTAVTSNNIVLGNKSEHGSNATDNIVVGSNSIIPFGVTSTNRAIIGNNGSVTCDDCMLLGDITTEINQYNVGIGVSGPTHQLHLSTSDAAKPGGGSWVIPSDKRLKKNINDFTDGLEILSKIEPVWFEYNGKAGIETKQQFVGVLAQDIQKIAPYMVGKHIYIDSTENREEYLSFDGDALKYITVNAIKEQQKQIKEKDLKIQDLEKRLDETDRKLNEVLAQLNNYDLKPKSTVNNSDNNPLLKQNTPNPFSTSTKIGFTIPQNSNSAAINIFDAGTNKLLKSFNVSNIKGKGEVVFEPSKFDSPNSYIYNLVIDEMVIDTKKMIKY